MRSKCRFCGNVRKEGVEWYDDDYCSGKCKKSDGGTIPAPIEVARDTGIIASLKDYYLDYPKEVGRKGRSPKRYRRRHEPEKLNWGEHLTPKQLNQAGLRKNREPIPGDYDFPIEEEKNE